MYSRVRSWEIPITTSGVPSSSHGVGALALDRGRPVYTKREVDHIGTINTRTGVGAEFRIIHPDGRRLILDYVLP